MMARVCRPIVMKKMLLLCGLLLSVAGYAQKKQLDHDVYNGWKHVAASKISTKGNYVAFQIVPQEGDGVLTLRRTKNGKELHIDRGYNLSLLPNEEYAVCLIKPFFADTRQAKIDKKKDEDMPKDTLAIIRLNDFQTTKIASVSSYKVGAEGNAAVAFISSDTTGIGKKAKGGKPLLIYHFKTAKTDTIKLVDKYGFDNNGQSIVYTTDDGKKHPTVGIYNVATASVKELGNGHRFYTLPTFDATGQQLLYLASADSADTGTKHCELYYYKVGEQASSQLVAADCKQDIPDGWGLNQYSSPFFSQNGQRIFAGVAQHVAPKDTSRVSFETAGLDVWTWNAPELPPAELKNMNHVKERTCLTVVNPKTGVLTPLTASVYDRIILPDQGNAGYALSVDRTNYMVESQWKYHLPQEVSFVDLETGHCTPFMTGVFGTLTTSPTGKYVIWYDCAQKAWFTYDTDSKQTANITANAGVNFWNEESDTPDEPRPYGIAAWAENDAYVLINDRYDIWQLAPDGSKSINLTAGHGRATNVTYRYLRTKQIPNVPGNFEAAGRDESIGLKEAIMLSIFDNGTKQGGYATLKTLQQATPTQLAKGDYMYTSLNKARNADIYIYGKQNFQNCPDLYLTTNWKDEKRLSNANPQQADYLWGTAELFKWNAYDGTPLEGLLYKPEDFDENKKYPVMIYFYERHSESLFSYYQPAPSRSTVNISFYCSRGYLVFVPDIVYTTGIPGESAYNCICSGAEALAQNLWVDKDNMAIQGQSWGGYQTAYLVTRTNMFKAAGAGAPVSNMTSAYGGIRWESGSSRQGQYEHGQSRIGRNLWEAPELYIANSPLFKADRVETPLLIMHNDADGAVPWYQGIEYFMALRRLGKPAWMLQYNNEAHNLTERRNCIDLSIRMQQFFDHYLKGAPAPAWMTKGIPSLYKGEYFGFETE